MKMRILIVVNKNREAKGFLDGFDGCKLLPAYKDLETHEPPEPWYRMADFRARYEFERFDVIIRWKTRGRFFCLDKTRER